MASKERGCCLKQLRYPTPTSNVAHRVAFLLLLAFILCVCSFVVAIHVFWWRFQWELDNGGVLIWKLRLSRVFAGASCQSASNPQFQAVCTAVLKNLFGTTTQVKEFICSLNSRPLNIAPQYEAAARSFALSCNSMGMIYRSLQASFMLVLFVGFFDICTFLLILRTTFLRFCGRSKIHYWTSISLQCLCVVLLIVPVSLLYFSVHPTLQDLFSEQRPLNIIDTHRDGTGGAEAGSYLGLVLILGHLILAILIACLLPVVTELRLVKDSAEKKGLIKKEQKESSSFWAYMPEVFHPDVYVAEFSPPEPILPSDISYQPLEPLRGMP